MKKFRVGLQLWSIRDDMEKDMDAALREVKNMGYDCVEFAGYYGKTAQEIKSILDKYELECISVHQSPDSFFEEGQNMIDFIKTLGVKYCAIPHYPKEKLAGTEYWNETVEKFTKLGKMMNENGIRLLYHNHDFEFNKADGKYLIDWIYDSISSELIDPEFDTCWIKYGGENPCEYIEKFAGRVNVLHLKDFVCKKTAAENRDATKEENGFEFRPVGYGIQDFKAILESAGKAGTGYIIVEQDNSVQRSSMEDAKLSREYLKTLGQ